jgi:hypothetical protein
VLVRQLGDDIMVFSKRSGATHRFSDVEAWVWQQLSRRGPLTVEELAHDVAQLAAAAPGTSLQEGIAQILRMFEQLSLATTAG